MDIKDQNNPDHVIGAFRETNVSEESDVKFSLVQVTQTLELPEQEEYFAAERSIVTNTALPIKSLSIQANTEDTPNSEKLDSENEEYLQQISEQSQLDLETLFNVDTISSSDNSGLYQGDYDLEDFKEEAQAQFTSVSSLSDVLPSDWSYQAVLSLVERYGCLAGYPSGGFNGNQAVTRYELAAAFNSCLDQIGDDFVDQEDLEKSLALQTEFNTELIALRNQVNDLESRLSTVASKQFSPTTVLGGEAIFGLAGATGGSPPGLGNTRILAAHLTRLQLATSFTGKDILRVQVSASNFANGAFANPNALNTNAALLSFQSDSKNQLLLDTVEYRFAPFDRLVFTVKPVGFSLSSVLTANSPYFDVGRGSISRFGEASPLFKIGNLDAGVGADWLLSSRLRLQAAYGTRDSGTPTEGGGLTDSDHRAAGVQLLLNPTDSTLFGLSYINAFSVNGQLDTFTGSNNADTSGGFNEPSTIHAANLTFQWRATPNLTLAAWGGMTVTDSRISDNIAGTFTYLGSIGYSDPFGREGDLIAVLAGQPPKLFDGLGVVPDQGTSIHTEFFYRFKVNDNISITPGLFLVTDPGHISANDNILVGTIRTTFRF